MERRKSIYETSKEYIPEFRRINQYLGKLVRQELRKGVRGSPEPETCESFLESLTYIN